MRHLLVFLLLAGGAMADIRAGSVTALLPSAHIERAGKNLKAKPGVEVDRDDLLRTDDQGRVRITLVDHSIISLGVKSQLRIVTHDSSSRQTSLELAFGKLRAQVAKITRAGGRFELRTPNAVAGVIGTDFGVDASDPSVTKFICLQGDVQLTSTDANFPGTVVCHTGTTVTFRRGQPPGPLQPATDDQMENWRTITEPDKAPANNPYSDY